MSEDEPVMDVDDRSSSDDDDDEDEDEDENLHAEITKLKEALRENPFLYDSYVSLIDLLGKSGDLDELRDVRKTFATNYPLTPEIWLAWIRDEERLAATEEERNGVFQLFEQAVQDYISVELWLEYCQFSLGILGSPEGKEKIRSIFERAVVAVGVHVTKGSLVWEAYREFENALLSMAPNSSDQVARLDKLFRRQLAVPLMNMETTFAEYSEWLSTSAIDANVERAYNTAQDMLKARQGIEDRLLNESNSFDTYKDYIDLEVKEGNPVRIQNIFERRAAEHCLNPSVWIEYAHFLETNLKSLERAFEVYQRGARNCPWSGSLWIKRIRCCEKLHKSPEEILKTVEAALLSGLSSTDYRDVWLAFIDYKRRTLLTDDDEDEDEEKKDKTIASFRSIFTRALEQLANIAGDPECKVARYWAALEADRFRDVEKARQIWCEITSGPAGEKAKYWVEFIHLEKMFGDTKHLRKLYPRALDKTQDWPEEIGELWLQFEREEGSIQSLEDAEKKVEARVKDAEAFRSELAADSQLKMASQKEKAREKRKEKRHQASDDKKRKRSTSDSDAPVVFKKPFLPTANAEVTLPKKVERDQVPPPPGYKGNEEQVAPPPGYKSNEEQVAPPPGYKSNEEELTVFVSNLDFSVDEDAVQSALGASDDIEEIRLVRNYSGKSKGYGFIKFKSASAAKAALMKDHAPINGRPMYVSECDPDKKKKGHQFKYSTSMEKNKLFIKGLAKTASKEDVAKLFAPFGALKDVRVVTYRNGHSKGIAYVDFTEDASASRAILKLDGTVIDGYQISVAVSNPPMKKEQPNAILHDVRSLGAGGGANAGPRGRARSQVSFVPTSVRKSTTSDSSSSNGQSESKTTMSNSDFRKMLLK